MYSIDYKILNYDSYHERLNKILNNPNNKYKVIKEENLGYTSCGFPIEHFKIGNGPIHITYMSGAHGNEIIGVDFVTQLMKNLALGNGDFESFDSEKFTIDFIPCQNPEGFCTTTYALSQIIEGMNNEKIEKFSKEYWQLYRNDDNNVNKVNKVLYSVFDVLNLPIQKIDLNRQFWKENAKNPIDAETIINFYTKNYNISKENIISIVYENWKLNFGDAISFNNKREHTEVFKDVDLKKFPETTEAHVKLKNKLLRMYENNKFPMGTLANFFANSDGINLNDNNPNFYKIMSERIKNEEEVYGNSRDNHIIRSIPGPLGLPNYDMSKDFEYSPENMAVMKYIEKQCEFGEYFAFFNCHGTGGMLYAYPYIDDEELSKENDTRNFNFYINCRIATEYTKKIGNVYEEFTGKNDPYKVMSRPHEITGFGDVLRKKYVASFLLELSKMGGNPIACYGDRKDNYELTMVSNFSAMMKTLQTVLQLENLYNLNYKGTYNDKEYIDYEIKPKTL